MGAPGQRLLGQIEIIEEVPDRAEHVVEFHRDFSIRESEHPESSSAQELVAGDITLVQVMVRAIYLDHETPQQTHEIHNERSNRLLAGGIDARVVSCGAPPTASSQTP